MLYLALRFEQELEEDSRGWCDAGVVSEAFDSNSSLCFHVFVTAPVEGAPKEACYNSMQTDWVGKVRIFVVSLEGPTLCEVAFGCVWRWVSLGGLVGSNGDQEGGAPELVGA